MFRQMLRSKIHRVTVTGAHLEYEGSLTIATDLMKAAEFRPFERILCSNTANGNRFETYVIPGKSGSGDIILNGAAAHLGKKGDRLTIMSFAAVSKRMAQKWKPRIIVLGKNNRIEIVFDGSFVVRSGHKVPKIVDALHRLDLKPPVAVLELAPKQTEYVLAINH